MRVASLDLGSNTFLLLIADFEKGKLCQVLHDEVVVTRLSEGVGSTRTLSPSALKRAEDCFAHFNQVINKFKPNKIAAVATSAARDAVNGSLFIELGKKYQIPIEIISGTKEAGLTATGAFVNLEMPNNFLIIDIGGGSTEFIQGISQEVEKVKSLNIGSVRLTEKFISEHPICNDELQKMDLFIHEEISNLSNDFNVSDCSTAFAVAGTPTTLAQLILKSNFNDQLIHGLHITIDQVENWRNKLSEMSVKEREVLPGMEPKRADMIVAGVSILFGFMKFFSLNKIVVSTKGVRYGLAMSQARGE